MKLQGKDACALCYFGEGTSSKGDFHVGLNFAAVRKAPVIFFCRNNQYAISTKIACQYASSDIATRGESYGITSIQVDGNDYFAVHEAVTKARQQCLAGDGPVLIEAMTYRLGAHSTSDDPSVYRTDAEVEEWKGKEPVLRLGRYLRKHNLWDDDKEKLYLDQVKLQIDEAIKVAKETPLPALSTIVKDVYFEVPPALQEQYRELKTFFPEST